MLYSEFDTLLSEMHKEHKEDAISIEVYNMIVEPMYNANSLDKREFVALLDYKALLKIEAGFNRKVVHAALHLAIKEYNAGIRSGLDTDSRHVDWYCCERLRKLCPENFKLSCDNYQLLKYIHTLVQWLMNDNGTKGQYMLEFNGQCITGVQTSRGYI